MKKAFGVLIAILWLLLALLLVGCGFFTAEVVHIGITVVVALLLTCRRRDLLKYHCHCFFGGLIICFFLMIFVHGGFSWTNLFSALTYAGIFSIPLVVTDEDVRRTLSNFFRESLIPPAMGGNANIGVGCFMWIFTICMAIFFTLVLGFFATLLFFFRSLKELYGNASLPWKSPGSAKKTPKATQTKPAAAAKPELNENTKPAAEKQPAKNAKTNKTVHWL